MRTALPITRTFAQIWSGLDWVSLIWVGLILIGQASLPPRCVAREGAFPLPERLQHVYPDGVPRSLDELRLMESHQRALIPELIQTTVAVQVGGIQGSGVIISREGVVLTAAHVASEPGTRAQITLANGRRVRGWTLGMNRAMDAGMIRLDPQLLDGKEVPWPFAVLGNPAELKPGTWCLALGHPGGYQKGREPVVRLGRVIKSSEKVLMTDCKLVGGDSGGPLFDMTGTVVGIHSRIGAKLKKNLHVPVGTFRETWDRLARGDVWGDLSDIVGRTVLGVYGATDSDEARISRLMPGSPAQQAGLKSGDLLTKFAGHEVKRFASLQDLVSSHQPGDEVKVEVLRDGERLSFSLILGGLSPGD